MSRYLWIVGLLAAVGLAIVAHGQNDQDAVHIFIVLAAVALIGFQTAK